MSLRVAICLLVFAVEALALPVQVTRFDPKTRRIGSAVAVPYFETRTLLAPGKVGLHLVVDLKNKRSAGWDSTGLFTAYVHNLTNEPLTLNISAMAHQRQPVPGAPVTIVLRPDTYEKVVLGTTGISRDATELEVEITYRVDAEVVTRTLVSRRLSQNEIKADVAAWKGRKRNVPEFFPDDDRVAGNDREFSIHDAPHQITFTIQKSRDTFELSNGAPSRFAGGIWLTGFTFTPPGGGPPNQMVSFFWYDRGRGKDEAVSLPVSPSVQEFVAEYHAHMDHFGPARFVRPQMGNVSMVRLGDRTWFRFRLIRGSTYSVQYWTPIDDKRMLVIDWSPPRGSLFGSREVKKLPEIEGLLASIRISGVP